MRSCSHSRPTARISASARSVRWSGRAAGYPGRSLFVFVNLVGIYAIFYGFTEVFAAFDLRGLGHRLEDRAARGRLIPDRPAGTPRGEAIDPPGRGWTG